MGATLVTTLGGASFVWLVGPSADVALSAADTARLAELHGDRRERFLRGRAALAAVLGAAHGGEDEVRPAGCPDCGRRHGQPEFSSGRAFASISHAGLGSLAAVADVPVGVDIVERARRTSNQLPISLPPGEQDELQHWTRIEATLKADGRGLRVDPASIEFSPTPKGAWLAVMPGGARYAVHDLTISD